MIRLFDMNVCYDCNFRCKFCYEEHENSPYKGRVISEPVINKWVNYLSYMKNLYPYDIFSVQFYGGEPTLHFNKIVYASFHAQHFVKELCIVTNGYLVERLFPKIIALRNSLRNTSGATLRLSISYNYCFQDQTRQEGTQSLIESVIKRVTDAGLLRKVITVFDKNTLPEIDKVFFEHVRLFEKHPALYTGFNLALSDDLSDFDYKKTEKALKRIHTFLSNNPDCQFTFLPNIAMHSRNLHWCLPDTLLANVVSVVDTDGGLYSDYTTLYQGENLRNLTRYGNVMTTDPEQLYYDQKAILENLDRSIPKECNSCNSFCKVPLYAKYLGLQYRFHPSSIEACKIRGLVTQYFDEFYTA